MPREKAVPSGEEVVEEVLKLAQKASGMSWTSAAVNYLRAEYLPTVSSRLQVPGAWRREGGNVYKAARELGIIAASISRLQDEKKVEQYVAVAARRLLAEQCDVAYGEGRYCR